MDAIRLDKEAVILALDVADFNFTREIFREFRRVVDPRELPALTGRTKAELDRMIDDLSAIADRLGIDL
ncbi:MULTISPECIES: hypothetical protein [unclassified Sinorhizobium]|uniref:hypothetical protein n=1 Tax=unclassified Sinorhizobium TaxID=2613772 RepID=UPI0035233F2A